MSSLSLKVEAPSNLFLIRFLFSFILYSETVKIFPVCLYVAYIYGGLSKDANLTEGLLYIPSL